MQVTVGECHPWIQCMLGALQSAFREPAFLPKGGDALIRNPYHNPLKRQDKIHPRAVSNVHLFIQVGQIRLSAILEECCVLRSSNSSQMHPPDELCNLVTNNLTFCLKNFNLFMHSWRNLESGAIGIGGCWDLLSGKQLWRCNGQVLCNRCCCKKGTRPSTPMLFRWVVLYHFTSTSWKIFPIGTPAFEGLRIFWKFP